MVWRPAEDADDAAVLKKTAHSSLSTVSAHRRGRSDRVLVDDQLLHLIGTCDAHLLRALA